MESNWSIAALRSQACQEFIPTNRLFGALLPFGFEFAISRKVRVTLLGSTPKGGAIIRRKRQLQSKSIWKVRVFSPIVIGEKSLDTFTSKIHVGAGAGAMRYAAALGRT